MEAFFVTIGGIIMGIKGKFAGNQWELVGISCLMLASETSGPAVLTSQLAWQPQNLAQQFQGLARAARQPISSAQQEHWLVSSFHSIGSFQRILFLDGFQ